MGIRNARVECKTYPFLVFLLIEDSAKTASFGSDVFRHTRRNYRHLLYPAHTLLVRGRSICYTFWSLS